MIFASSLPESALHDDDVFECVREESALVKQNGIIDIPNGPGMWRRRGSITPNSIAEVEETWEEAVKRGKIKTTWRHELGIMITYSVNSTLRCCASRLI